MCNGKFYIQIEGLPMGSSLSPILAAIVLDELLEQGERCWKDEVKFIRKYVDDFVAIIDGTKLEKILATLNGYDRKIQFTTEQEVDRSLPFLDMRIHVDKDGRLWTEWYSKPYVSGRLLNYWSKHPMMQKIVTVVGFMNKVVMMTDEQYLPNAVKNLTRILRLNGYPEWLIAKLFKRWEKGEERIERPVGEEIKYVGMTYVPGYTEIISKILSEELKIRIVPRAIHNVRSILPRLKDAIPDMKKSNVIYSIPCMQCDDRYIGQTRRYLGKRIQEHVKSIERIWLKPELGPKTGECALAEHYRNQEHTMNFEATTVLDIERNQHKRRTLESLHILSTERTCNYRNDTNGISRIYAALVHTETRH